MQASRETREKFVRETLEDFVDFEEHDKLANFLQTTC